MEIDTLIEQVTDFLILLFAVTPGNEYLCPDAETEGNHEDDHVEDTGDGRCSQFDFAHTPEKAVSVIPISCSIRRLIRMG